MDVFQLRAQVVGDYARYMGSFIELQPLRLYRHQIEGIHAARAGDNYVLPTGTGSGKSLSYIVPIVDHVLRTRGQGRRGIQAIVVYPMNALANSQLEELRKYIELGFDRPLVRFARYTGQESHERREQILADPPDILLTNRPLLQPFPTTRPSFAISSPPKTPP